MKLVTIAGLLGVLFVGLKLTDHIMWSWLWVLAPLGICLALVVESLMIIAASTGLGTAIDRLSDRMRR